jgi:hypothetical protein
MPESLTNDVQKVEEAIRRRVCIGGQVVIGKLM